MPDVDIGSVPADVAVKLAILSLGPQRWINRRVEQVSYLDQETIRRHITVDFDVPEQGLLPCAHDQDTAYLPIAEFTKRTLVHFDFCTSGGDSIAMLTADQNSRLSAAMLLALARLEAGELVDAITERHISRLVRLNADDPSWRFSWQRIFPPDVTPGQPVNHWPAFSTVADNLCRNFIVYLSVRRDEAGARRIVKLTFDSPRPAPGIQGIGARLGWRDVADSFTLPFAGYCASYHFELEAPPGMEITKGRFLATRKGEPVLDSLGVPTRRAHFNLSKLDGSDGLVMVALRARSREVLGGIALLSVMNAAILFFISARVHAFTRDHGIDAVVTALLVLPGLFIGYMARPTEHELLASFLAGLRYVALASGLASFTAALILFAGYRESTLQDLLWMFASVAGIAAIALTTSWFAGRRRVTSSRLGATFSP